jgi:hypothetical protein
MHIYRQVEQVDKDSGGGLQLLRRVGGSGGRGWRCCGEVAGDDASVVFDCLKLLESKNASQFHSLENRTRRCSIPDMPLLYVP